MSALLFALTVLAAFGAALCVHDTRKAARLAVAERFRAEDAANRAQYTANLEARWQG